MEVANLYNWKQTFYFKISVLLQKMSKMGSIHSHFMRATPVDYYHWNCVGDGGAQDYAWNVIVSMEGVNFHLSKNSQMLQNMSKRRSRNYLASQS